MVLWSAGRSLCSVFATCPTSAMALKRKKIVCQEKIGRRWKAYSVPDLTRIAPTPRNTRISTPTNTRPVEIAHRMAQTVLHHSWLGETSRPIRHRLQTKGPVTVPLSFPRYDKRQDTSIKSSWRLTFYLVNLHSSRSGLLGQ